MILLDTSFLVAYFNRRDQNHKNARNIINDIVSKKFGSIYLTDYIFNETVTVSLIKTKDLNKTTSIGDYLLKSLEMIWIDENLFSEGWKIFCNQRGTRLGFTDCTTIAAMRYNDIDIIATFDKDFTKVDGIKLIGIQL